MDQRRPYDIAQTQLGLNEKKNAAALKDYLETGGVNLDPATTAWCAAFVNSSLAQAGLPGTGSPAARSFARSMAPRSSTAIPDPRSAPNRRPCRFLTSRPTKPQCRPCRFLCRPNRNRRHQLLGGNQGRKGEVSVKPYPTERLLGFRRPPAADNRDQLAQLLSAVQNGAGRLKMARDPQITEVPVTVESAERGKPDVQETGYNDDPYSGPQYDEPVDKKYWIACLSDAERAEENWRKRGREIVQIYRNDGKSNRSGRVLNGDIIFNILYANTEVMLPAVYQKPPKPVVRSRFTKAAEPPPPPMPMPPMGMPGAPGGAPAMPPGPPDISLPLPGGPPPPIAPGGLPSPAVMPPPPAMGPTPLPPGGAPLPPSRCPRRRGSACRLARDGWAVGWPRLMPPPPPLPPPIIAPPLAGPPQDAIETAAAVMEKALTIVLDDDNSDEAVQDRHQGHTAARAAVSAGSAGSRRCRPNPWKTRFWEAIFPCRVNRSRSRWKRHLRRT